MLSFCFRSRLAFAQVAQLAFGPLQFFIRLVELRTVLLIHQERTLHFVARGFRKPLSPGPIRAFPLPLELCEALLTVDLMRVDLPGQSIPLDSQRVQLRLQFRHSLPARCVIIRAVDERRFDARNDGAGLRNLTRGHLVRRRATPGQPDRNDQYRRIPVHVISALTSQ